MDRREFLTGLLASAALVNLPALAVAEPVGGNLVLTLPTDIEVGDMVYVAAISGREMGMASAGWVRESVQPHQGLIATVWRKTWTMSDPSDNILLDLSNTRDACATAIHIRNRVGQPITVMSTSNAQSPNVISKEQFIENYMRRSNLDAKYRTPDGFHVPGSERRIAMPCDCGEDICEGWAWAREDELSSITVSVSPERK